MAETGNPYWTGQSGTTAQSNVVLPVQGGSAVARAKEVFEAERKRIEDAERRRIEFGEDVQIDLTGFDRDVKNDLSSQLGALKDFYSEMMNQNINPQDMKNVDAYRKYNGMRDRLMADIKASTDQKAFYQKALATIYNDPDNGVYDKAASLAALEKYRSASIAERAEMGMDILVPRVKGKKEAMTDFFNGWIKSQTGGSIRDEEGNVVGNFQNIDMRMDDMKEVLRDVMENPEDPNYEGFNRMFPAEYDEDGLLKKTNVQVAEDYLEDLYPEFEKKVSTYFAPKQKDTRLTSAQEKMIEKEARAREIMGQVDTLLDYENDLEAAQEVANQLIGNKIGDYYVLDPPEIKNGNLVITTMKVGTEDIQTGKVIPTEASETITVPLTPAGIKKLRRLVQSGDPSAAIITDDIFTRLEKVDAAKEQREAQLKAEKQTKELEEKMKEAK